jgi:hypothetical protein
MRGEKPRRSTTPPLILLAFILAGCQTASGPPSFEGRPIVLNPDGSWKYVDAAPPTRSFTKSDSARGIVLGKAGFYNLWYDETKWSTRAALVKDTEFEFTHVDGDRFAHVFAERIEVPRPALKKAITDRFKARLRDARITLDEVRRVNDIEVLCIEVEGISEGIPMKSIGYLWSGSKGTLQVYGFTGRNLFDEFRGDLTELLNGLVVKP